MFIASAKDIAVGTVIYSGYDDRPFDGYGYEKGIVTQIFDNHYLFDEPDLGIINVWGDYEECDTVANFTTEDEVKKWLRLYSRGRKRYADERDSR